LAIREDEPTVESLAFAKALDEVFKTLNMSRRAYAARYNRDHTTFSRIFSGKRVPHREIVDEILSRATESGHEVTEEVREHLFRLHMDALRSKNPDNHRILELSDQLTIALLNCERAEQQETLLQEELRRQNQRQEILRDELRRHRAATDLDQITHGAELAVYHEENQRLTAETEKLRNSIATLRRLLDQTRARREQAEKRCRDLEEALGAAEDAIEAERQRRLRLEEAAEEARAAEEQRLRTMIAEQDAELERLRAFQNRNTVELPEQVSVQITSAETIDYLYGGEDHGDYDGDI